ncbi:MAG: NYN domain-containing protein [Myxococcales bacterium]|nr:NYN domain-containing protein [Myxococcales bacterium]
MPTDSASTLAVFIDLENLAIGVGDAKLGDFDIKPIFERLLDKGNVVVRRAYADWKRWETYRRPLYGAGIELIELPGGLASGKNSADIRMVVDVLELSYAKPHIDTFALVTGDSDFYPLVAKLRENNKRTIAVGVKASTSKLLIDTCDEFIFYDDLVRERGRRKAKGTARLPKPVQEAFDLVIDAVEALLRENREPHSSLVKETIQRKQPQFSEQYHGYRSFNRLLEDAAKHGLISIRKDARSGTYVVDDVTEEANT